eukprot:1179983-Prorocentrum_minimum.AAC.3
MKEGKGFWGVECILAVIDTGGPYTPSCAPPGCMRGGPAWAAGRCPLDPPSDPPLDPPLDPPSDTLLTPS